MRWRVVGSPVVRYDLLGPDVDPADYGCLVLAAIGADDGIPGGWYAALDGEAVSPANTYADVPTAWAALAARVAALPELPDA